MEYKKLATMKKDYFCFRDGKINYVIDSSAVVSAVAECDDLNRLSGGYPSGLLSTLVSGNINSFLGRFPASWDMGYFSIDAGSGRKYYFDFVSEKTCVYNRDSGRQLYQFIRVSGLRLASFRPSAGWHDNADYSVIFGKWSGGFQFSNDIEISA